MIGHHEPKMLALILGSQGVHIDGDVCVDAPGLSELIGWASVLSNPAAFAWRSTATGERHLQVGGWSTQDPVHGRVTVLLDGDHHRDVWDTVLADDLRCGDEKRLDLDRLRRVALTRERREQAGVAA